MINYAFPTEINKVIKVIGVGGGGCNAVNHMYNEGIHNVTFAVCNADIQDLGSSPVPTKLQIGKKLTAGLGCGAKPETGREAALESEDEIKELLSDGTKMVFITAGMGGGTGTGAAPVIARIAKEMGILTIGIVTIPFKLEMGSRIKKALAGVAEMDKYVDALLIINNERLITLYPTQTLEAAFYKTDEVLSESAKSIAEMITLKGEIVNVDFADVDTILRQSGVAIMNTGMADGENRVNDAISEALTTPLLNNNDIKKATRILLYVYTSKEHTLTMKEMGEISEFAKSIDKNLEEEFIWGGTYDEKLESSIKITIIATGFALEDIPDINNPDTFYGPKEPKQESIKQADMEVEQKDSCDNADTAIPPEANELETETENKDDLEEIAFSDWADNDDDFSNFDIPPSKR